MPIVEQSRMRLEYPAGDEVPGPINDKIVLRARVSPARINTRVWFAFQIDEEPWVRREAVRESASADSQQYSLTVDISTGQTGLKYLAYVRRNGVTVPSGADSTTPYNNQRLQEFTAFLSLTNEDSKSRDPHSGNEIIEESGVKFPDKDASAGTPIAASLEAAATESGASLVLREQPAELREASAISSPRTLLSEIQPSRDVPTTSTEPLRSPQPSSPITSAETNPRHVEGHVFVDRGLPGNGIRLRIYNREGDGTETRLGEVTTDERGSYTLAYDIGRNTANLEVRGLDAQGNEVPLSELNVDAARSEVMNLIARADLQRYASGETLCAPEPTAADNAKWTIPGRLQSQSSDLKILAGCRVDVFFEQKTLVEAGEEPVAAPGGGTIPVFREAGFVGVANENPHATETAGVKMRVSVRPDDLGIFMVMLPSKAKLAGRIVRFMVSSPSGETLADKCFDIDTIPDFVLMPITRVASIPQPTVVPLPETRRIKGKVIERNCRPLPSCLQILLFAHKNTQDVTEAGGEPTPIFVASTDSSGYFFGEIPNQKYESAMAKIAGIEDQIYIALEDGYIPARVLLVVDLPENGLDQATRDGCNCAVSIVPRTPTYSDIEEASDTYSADLGAGGCIQFNTPNRAIEEFDFYSVVRTTEPDIRALGGDTSHGTTHVGNSGSDILTDDLINAVELATKALNQEVEATTSDTAAEVAEAEKIATQREAEAKAAREYLTEIEGKNLGDFISHTGNETIFLTEKYLQDQRALVERAEAVATAARVAADSAKVRAVTISEDAEVTTGSLGAIMATVKKALEEARARAKAAAARAKTATKPPGRAELNTDNSVDWDSTPTFYEATTIALGHLLHFKQVWYADGYSLGDLLYSLPLAPGQKKLISVLDWERREGGQRTEDTFSGETLTAALRRDRDLGEVVSGTLTESSRGGSKSTSAGVGVGTGAAGNGSYQGFNFGALIGISGGYGESNSSAWQDSSRSLSSNSLQTLRDNTLQSASAIRSLRSSVVQTVTQGEAVRATTEVVANHNHCHALTIQYFEVLRHLKVTHELTDVQECLFVPLPMTEFDRPKALRWRQTLQLYLQRPELSGAFDATRRVETAWTEVDYPANRYADEQITSVAGELQLTLLIPLPPFQERPKPRPEDTLIETAEAIEKATNPTTGFLGGLLAVVTGGASLAVSAATQVAVDTTKAVTAGARALAEDLYSQPTAQERYDKFQQEVMPGVVEGFVNQLELHALVNGAPVRIPGADFTLASEYRPGVPLLVSVRVTLATPIKRGDVSQLIIKSANGLPTGCRAIVNSATIRYRTSKFQHIFVDDRRVNDDIDLPKISVSVTNLFQVTVNWLADGNGAALFTPIDEWEQRNPKIEDSRLAAELIEHLNANLEFYHHAIWWTMDPNRRYMLLDGYRAPGANGRSVASVIENRLIGITGNSLVMPVARGNHLDPRFPKGQNANLLDFYALDSPVPAARVSLPTRGVFAEAVMGSCNACEQIDDSRFWRWEESPIDEPPTIEPLSTATRRSEPANMQPTAFPTPIVSIQNAPSVPNPTGVGAVLQALGQESFRDMAGLAGTQANAAAAYQQALDTAYKFGKEASTLAQQAAMLKAGDKTMSAIDNAEADGKITADEAKELRMSALKKMVGETSPEDKASQQAEVDQKKATTDAIKSIPPENIKAVETPTAKVAAKPKPKPAVGPKVQNFPIGLKSHSTFTGGVQRPLDGNITLDISPTGNLASMAPISYLIPVNGGVGAPQQVSLAAGMYGVTVRYAPSKLSDLAFLREPQLESVGVNLGRLVEGVFDLMQKDLASDWEISAPVEGELFEVPDKCKGLSFSLLAEMVESPALSFDAELGADEGFTIAADGKVSFDSSKLAGLATTIAETLKIKQATLLAALLSLFTVQASIDNNKHITIAGAQKVKLNFKPAILKRFVLTQIK